jgi:hypothetical protein
VAPPVAKKKAETITSEDGADLSESDPAVEQLVAASQVPAEVTSVNAKRIWDSGLAAVEGLLRENADLCESVSAAGGNRLVATFRAKYTSCRAFCERQATSLEEALSAAAGGRVKLEFTTIADVPQPAANQPRRAAPQRQRVAELKEHAMVRRATELFDAQIVRVEDPETAS